MTRIIILTEKADAYQILHEAFGAAEVEHSARGGCGLFYMDGEEYSTTFTITLPNAGLRQIEELVEDYELPGRVAVFKDGPSTPALTGILKEIDQTIAVGSVDE